MNHPEFTRDYSKAKPIRKGIPVDAESLIYAGTKGAPEVNAEPLPPSIPKKDTESLLGWQVKKQPQEVRPTPPPVAFNPPTIYQPTDVVTRAEVSPRAEQARDVGMDAQTVKIEKPRKASFFGAIQAGREKVTRWLSSNKATAEAPKVQTAAAKYETTISAALDARLQQIEGAVARFIEAWKKDAQEAQRARALAEARLKRERAAQSLREREAEIKILQERFGLYIDYQV